MSIFSYTASVESVEPGLASDATKAKQIVYALKRNQSGFTSRIAKKALEIAQRSQELIAFLDGAPTLVPMPGSAKQLRDSLWVPKIICDTISELGYGDVVSPVLRRQKPVPKSAFAAPGERPGPNDHFESMVIDELPSANILLVDDVITRGATILGAAQRILTAFPNANVKALALVRTLYPQKFRSVVDTCVGTVVHEQDNLWENGRS